MLRIVHPVAGIAAFLLILTFWLATAATELFGTWTQIAAVKTAIPWGFLLLVPALAATGVSGFVTARGRRGPTLDRKRMRMGFIAANGVMVLIPSALFLAGKAQAGSFDASFYAIQAVELSAGAVNLLLLGLNMKDGLQLTKRLRKTPA